MPAAAASHAIQILSRPAQTAANAKINPAIADGGIAASHAAMVSTHSATDTMVLTRSCPAKLANNCAKGAPKLATTQRSLAKRQKQQVYVDSMQNARGKTIASVFSARARPGATVSMPLLWKQIEKGVKIADFTIKNVPKLVEKNGNAWEEFFEHQQILKL